MKTFLVKSNFGKQMGSVSFAIIEKNQIDSLVQALGEALQETH